MTYVHNRIFMFFLLTVTSSALNDTVPNDGDRCHIPACLQHLRPEEPTLRQWIELPDRGQKLGGFARLDAHAPNEKEV